MNQRNICPVIWRTTFYAYGIQMTGHIFFLLTSLLSGLADSLLYSFTARPVHKLGEERKHDEQLQSFLPEPILVLWLRI
jgi:hypothetical protein